MKLHPLLGSVKGNTILGLIGSGDDKVSPGSNIAKTQAEIDAANMEAKRFATARGLVSGPNTYVAKNPGDKLPQYIDSKTGKPFVSAPAKARAMVVPNSIMADDIKSDGNGNFWYDDPTTGDLVDVDPSVLNIPRFRKSKEANNDAMALIAQKFIGKK